MRPRTTLLQAAVAAAALSGASAHAAEFTTFGSSIIYLDQLAVPSNITCYLTNFGGKPARVKDLRLFNRESRLVATANTCGPSDGLDLPPRSSCYIGVNPLQPSPVGHGCGALVEAGASVRGEIELRDAGAKARASAELTTETGGVAADQFRTIATPPLFGAGDQTNATCVFTNLGATSARISNVRMLLGDGSSLTPRMFATNCPDGPEVVAPPGQTCQFTSTVPVGTVQCRAQVTRRSNVRGALFVIKAPATILNRLPLQ